MGANQGIIRYTRGYSRRVTKSELLRGYLFISRDKKIMGNKQLRIILNGTEIKEKKLDKEGRIGVGKSIMNQIGNKEIFSIFEGNKLKITF